MGKRMNCHKFEKYELGELNRADFMTHLKSCPACRAKKYWDDQLLRLARNLKQPVSNINLWPEIKYELEKENKSIPPIFKNPAAVLKYRPLILQVAAVLIAGIILSIYFISAEQIPDKGILDTEILKRVEDREEEYFKALVDLEKSANHKMNQMDMNLMLLYRDKLETIETQIENCREAIAQNPANAHLRRYLLSALQDKKDTLKEIVNYNLKPASIES